MSWLTLWISTAVMVGLDHFVHSWTKRPHPWGASFGAVIAVYVVAWGVWRIVGRHGGLRTVSERRRYLVTLAMILLVLSWFVRGAAR